MMARRVELTPERLAEELSRLESEYGMPSDVFFERYQAGGMGDSKDVVRWAWLCSVAARKGVLAPTART